MALFLKSLIGAGVVILISLLSKSKYYYIAGLAPLFPTFALIAHYSVGSSRPVADLRETILFSGFATIPMLTYLVALYALVGHFRLVPSLLMACLAWGIAAWILVTLWGQFHGH
ncbi:membrane protein [Leminorella grimontii]|uniref:Membrane protein n=1 Tax=Leminorella grimontii TaxID=82981 RepID=A0AAV5N0M0_9GAMM|nr:GlpM family protein [Leminorella grimontii]KFC93631.1 membrane protein [Leminorella grimontii ATCC 33999 = DSM 5078]GKX55671.1 membrane protein [Leminorella grimontii]GKX59481.1 membrane protein [Leminorella grimontii]VFS55394.1 Inner membrane protein ydgC [Leminorella grimontii]